MFVFSKETLSLGVMFENDSVDIEVLVLVLRFLLVDNKKKVQTENIILLLRYRISDIHYNTFCVEILNY